MEGGTGGWRGRKDITIQQREMIELKLIAEAFRRTVVAVIAVATWL